LLSLVVRGLSNRDISFPRRAQVPPASSLYFIGLCEYSLVVVGVYNTRLSCCSKPRAFSSSFFFQFFCPPSPCRWPHLLMGVFLSIPSEAVRDVRLHPFPSVRELFSLGRFTPTNAYLNLNPVLLRPCLFVGITTLVVTFSSVNTCTPISHATAHRFPLTPVMPPFPTSVQQSRSAFRIRSASFFFFPLTPNFGPRPTPLFHTSPRTLTAPLFTTLGPRFLLACLIDTGCLALWTSSV